MKKYARKRLRVARCAAMDAADDILNAVITLAVTDSAEASADVLFNTKDKQVRAENIAFLKATRVKDVTFADTDKNPDFLIIDSNNNGKISVSNRIATRSEIRGPALRELIDAAKKRNDNPTLYEVINQALRSASSSHVYLLRHSPAHETLATEMSSSHYHVFMHALMIIAWQKITSGLDPKSPDFWNGLDIGEVFDSTSYVEQIKIKSEQLEKRGDTQAAKAASHLYLSLSNQLDKLASPTSDILNVYVNCKGLIECASESELKNHRNVFSRIWHGLLKLLNFLVGGHYQPPLTDSCRILKEALTRHSLLFAKPRIGVIDPKEGDIPLAQVSAAPSITGPA